MLRNMLPKEYKTYTGKVMTDTEVMEYNWGQTAINADLERNLEPCEDLLNLSHHLLQKAATK